MIEKNVTWGEQNDVARAEVEGRFPHGERFAVIFRDELVDKKGERSRLDEVALFTVARGKIAREEFFYQT